MDRYKWSILRLCEMRWKKSEEIQTDGGNRVYCNGKEDKHEQEDAAFLVHKDIVKSVIGCRLISSGLMTVRLRACPSNISIIQVYAPKSSHDDSEVDEFYRELQSLVYHQSRTSWLYKVIGTRKSEKMHKKIGEKFMDFSAIQRPDRGLKLLDRNLQNLELANTVGNNKPSRRWTWHSPDGTHHNQTDCTLKKKRFRSGIKTARTRTFPGADVGSDHDMVMMIFQTRLKNSRKPSQPRIRFDLKKLNDPTVMSGF